VDPSGCEQLLCNGAGGSQGCSLECVGSSWIGTPAAADDPVLDVGRGGIFSLDNGCEQQLAGTVDDLPGLLRVDGF